MGYADITALLALMHSRRRPPPLRVLAPQMGVVRPQRPNNRLVTARP